MFDLLATSTDADNLAFFWMKCHLPFSFPSRKLVEVFLQTRCMITLRVFCKVHYGVISEEPYFRVDIFRDIVNVEEKETWSED